MNYSELETEIKRLKETWGGDKFDFKNYPEILGDFEKVRWVAELGVKYKLRVHWDLVEKVYGRDCEKMLELVRINANAIEGIDYKLFQSDKYVRRVFRAGKKAPYYSYPNFYWGNAVYYKKGWDEPFPPFVKRSSNFRKLKAGVIV